MSVEHERLKEILAAAAGKATPEVRAAFLDDACRGDAALRQQVEALLSAHARAGDFLEKTVEVSPADFVIATGVSVSLEDFVRDVFANVGLDWREHVEQDVKNSAMKKLVGEDLPEIELVPEKIRDQTKESHERGIKKSL